MTVCELITKPITRMVEQENKNLDQIAESICPTVEYGREKIIRVIKDFLGEQYLIDHSSTLGYDVEMAQRAKKGKHQKIPASTDNDSDDKKCQKSSKKKPSLKKAIKDLLKYYSADEIIAELDASGKTF